MTDASVRRASAKRSARIQLAGRLGLPVVTIVDTRGADPLPVFGGCRHRGGHRADVRRDARLPAPTLAVVTGEGGSGGALAFTVADHVLAFSSAVFSVIAPEAAAAILYRDASRAPELAERLGITADDLVRFGPGRPGDSRTGRRGTCPSTRGDAGVGLRGGFRDRGLGGARPASAAASASAAVA